MTNTSASFPHCSEGDDAGDEPAAAAPSGTSHEECQQVGNGLIRLPATSSMPAPRSDSFVMDLVLTFRVTSIGGVALIQEPALLQRTRAPNSVKPPMWANVGLRPVVGTTIDLKVQPTPLSDREKLLLLSCWQQWNPAEVQGSALSHWLVGVDVEQGPDGIDSPTFLKQNFDVLEAVHLYQEAQLSPLEDLFDVNSLYPEGINQLALRISTYEYPLGALLAIYFLSATGHMPSKFPLDHWIKAVQWHGDSKVAAFVNIEDEWADAQTLLTPLENIVVEAESKQGAVVWSSTQKDHPAILKDSLPLKLVVRPENDIQRHLPATLHVEATGLGGRDLTYPVPWDISIRTDKEGQLVYGPSLAPLGRNCGCQWLLWRHRDPAGLCVGQEQSCP